MAVSAHEKNKAIKTKKKEKRKMKRKNNEKKTYEDFFLANRK